MIQSKKGQMEMDELGLWVGLILGVIGAIIGLIIAKKMDVGIFMRLLNAAVVGVICFFIGWKIADSG